MALFKKNIPTNNYYRTMMKSMLMIGFFLPFIPMVLISGVMFYQFHGAYKKNVNTHFNATVQKGRHLVDHFLEENLRLVRLVAETVNFEEARESAFLKKMLDVLASQGGPGFTELSVFNEKGIRVAGTGVDRTAEASYRNAEWYQKTIKTGYVISDVKADPKSLHRIILAVRHDWNKERWVLQAVIKTGGLDRLLQNLRPGETGSVFILNKDGQCITKKDGYTIPEKTDIKGFLKADEKNKDTISIVQRKDSSGYKTIYGTARLKQGDWFLVFKQRLSEEFSSLHKALTISIIVLAVVVLCIAANAYSLTKKMVVRIEAADKQKQKMNEQMFQTQKMASIGELAVGVAHEINNPVAIMVEEAGWIEDLLEEEEFRKNKHMDEMKRALKQIKTQGMRCREINYKLLSFARKTGSKVKAVQLKQLIEESIANAIKTGGGKNVTIHQDIQADLPLIEVPPTELQQVLINLIHNAFDAMENKNGKLSVSARLRNSDILIDVCDNGSGIPKENLSKIFDPFFTTKPVGKGTGLGLSICYGIIKELGGEITVDSEIQNGSKFHIILPLSKLRTADDEKASEARNSV